MATAMNSFDRSALGAFVKSPLGARNNPLFVAPGCPRCPPGFAFEVSGFPDCAPGSPTEPGGATQWNDFNFDMFNGIFGPSDWQLGAFPGDPTPEQFSIVVWTNGFEGPFDPDTWYAMSAIWFVNCQSPTASAWALNAFLLLLRGDGLAKACFIGGFVQSGATQTDCYPLPDGTWSGFVNADCVCLEQGRDDPNAMICCGVHPPPTLIPLCQSICVEITGMPLCRQAENLFDLQIFNGQYRLDYSGVAVWKYEDGLRFYTIEYRNGQWLLILDVKPPATTEDSFVFGLGNTDGLHQNQCDPRAAFAYPPFGVFALPFIETTCPAHQSGEPDPVDVSGVRATIGPCTPLCRAPDGTVFVPQSAGACIDSGGTILL